MKTTFSLLLSLTVIYNLLNAQGSWLQRPTFSGAARSDAVGFSIGGKAYIGTGNGNSSNYDDFWQYDTINGVWSQLANVTGGNGRYGAVGFAIGSKGYIGTGSTGGNNNSLDDFYEYDPATNNWSTKASLPGVDAKRRYAFAFSIGGKGYIGGGDGINANPNDLLEYNPNSNIWTPVASNVGATGYDYAEAFVIANKAYIGVGNNQTFFEWDPTSGAWTPKASYPGLGVNYLFAFAIDSFGYMGGGRDVSNTNEVQDFWQYDPSLDQWTQKANFGGGGRADAVGLTIGNRGYAGLGFIGSNEMQDFWQYTPDITTGIEQRFAELVIYPNPCTGILKVHNFVEGEIHIYDLASREIFYAEVENSPRIISIDLSDQPEGVYLMLLKSDAALIQRKIILAR